MPALGLELRWRALRLHDDDLRRVPCATAALGAALAAALATAAIPSAAVASAAIPAPAVASALSAAVASTVASVPMCDLLEDLRIMRCRHLLMEPRHLEVRGALRKPPDLL